MRGRAVEEEGGKEAVKEWVWIGLLIGGPVVYALYEDGLLWPLITLGMYLFGLWFWLWGLWFTFRAPPAYKQRFWRLKYGPPSPRRRR